MFVGVGASRVRDLFEDAKKHAPCIIFIDEIDAVARRRGTGMGGGHDEREQTLNQLLVEMDGFGVNEGIIVMAATNRVDILDPAILRPGRFDRKVLVGRPDVQEDLRFLPYTQDPSRSEMTLICGRSRRRQPDLPGRIWKTCSMKARFTRQSRPACTLHRRISGGHLSKSESARRRRAVISDKEKRITAYHESGHAILFHLLPDVGPVYTVSIIPTGNGAAGYTMPLPEKDEMFNTKGKMLQDITVSLEAGWLKKSSSMTLRQERHRILNRLQASQKRW